MLDETDAIEWHHAIGVGLDSRARQDREILEQLENFVPRNEYADISVGAQGRFGPQSHPDVINTVQPTRR
jgi:hypothetical protein